MVNPGYSIRAKDVQTDLKGEAPVICSQTVSQAVVLKGQNEGKQTWGLQQEDRLNGLLLLPGLLRGGLVLLGRVEDMVGGDIVLHGHDVVEAVVAGNLSHKGGGVCHHEDAIVGMFLGQLAHGAGGHDHLGGEDLSVQEILQLMGLFGSGHQRKAVKTAKRGARSCQLCCGDSGEAVTGCQTFSSSIFPVPLVRNT